MTWHLKDCELEEKLIAIDPEFLKSLNGAVNDFLIDFSRLETNKTIKFMFCKADLTELGDLYFFLSDLEEIPEYDPNKWNEYPTVKPPKDVCLRVEVDTPYKTVRLFGKKDPDSDKLLVAISNGNFFTQPEKHFDCKAIRFRPWSED